MIAAEIKICWFSITARAGFQLDVTDAGEHEKIHDFKKGKLIGIGNTISAVLGQTEKKDFGIRIYWKNFISNRQEAFLELYFSF